MNELIINEFIIYHSSLFTQKAYPIIFGLSLFGEEVYKSYIGYEVGLKLD
jgi:hypothetical protein